MIIEKMTGRVHAWVAEEPGGEPRQIEVPCVGAGPLVVALVDLHDGAWALTITSVKFGRRAPPMFGANAAGFAMAEKCCAELIAAAPWSDAPTFDDRAWWDEHVDVLRTLCTKWDIAIQHEALREFAEIEGEDE